MKDKIFYILIVSFLIGIVFSSLVYVNIYTCLFFGLLSAIILFSSVVLSKRKLLVISLSIIVFTIACLRVYVKDYNQRENILDNFTEESVEIKGLVYQEVEQRQSSQRIIIRAESINYLGKEYLINDNILVSSELYPRIEYGDVVLVKGRLSKPENFITDIGKEFDYKNYLKKESIYYIVSFADIEVLDQGQGTFLKTQILNIKGKFLNSISQSIPAPESSLLSGLLLGVKESLGEGLEQDFVDTGLIHIVVLSGYNVTIIAEAIIRTLSFVSITAGIYIGGFAIALFAIMTGAGATIVRASIMAILALIARATGRRYEITRALFIAGTLMVLENPYILLYDISFHLSFLATFGLIYLSPIFESIFKFFPKRFGLREIVGATIATQVFVFPFILYKIGNLSLIAPITNILVLPLIPATMLFGFLGGFLHLLVNFLGAPFAFIAFLLLRFEILVVEMFADLPFASIKIADFSLALMLVSYGFIFWWMRNWYIKRRNET